jgi:dolichol-phosphate mannosyltransferase
MATPEAQDRLHVKRLRLACLGAAGLANAVLFARFTRLVAGRRRLGPVLGPLTSAPLLLGSFGRSGARRTPTEGIFGYDIHGIVTIVSDAPLPELARFSVDAPIRDPLITVRLGPIRSAGAGVVELAGNRTLIRYQEWLGSLGFAAEIELGERIRIVACPPLGRSPHVLYTKVIEPVLRWAFVERGYALVVAACMAYHRHAFLITARTAGLRTMMTLGTLDRLPCSFVSDHHALVAADGRVLTYPEPVTINRRTLAACTTSTLRRRDRMALLVQSRLHSRFGRRLGTIVARLGLPAATLNMLVQHVVPPPQYPVERLLPQAHVMTKARLAAVTVIQSEEEEERLGHPDLADTVEILLGDPEGSGGLPPDPSVKPWLYMRNGTDLRDVEREIVIRAIANTPLHLLHSPADRWQPAMQRILEQSLAEAEGRSPAGVSSATVRPASDDEPSSHDRRPGP